jgi:amino acid permease
MASSKELTVFEAASIVAGYGIGAGIMAVPWMASRSGVWTTLLVVAVAYAVSVLLHLMIAQLALGSVTADGGGLQIVEIFRKWLFRGPLRTVLTWAFFVVMFLVLTLNLAAYVAGAGDIIQSLTGLPVRVGGALFSVLAAGVVVLGLKALGVSEKIAVVSMLALFAALFVGTMTVPFQPLALTLSLDKAALALFGAVMFCFASFFSVPQVVEGLRSRPAKMRGAVMLGIAINLAIVLLVTLLALLASREVTQVAIVGWAAAIGPWAAILGSVFFLLALLTTYWSISYALSTIVRERLGLGRVPAWLLSTLPNIALALTGFTGFLGFVRLAGGAIALLVALLLVPAYLSYRASQRGQALLIMSGRLGWQAWAWVAMAGYLVMAVGSFVGL